MESHLSRRQFIQIGITGVAGLALMQTGCMALNKTASLSHTINDTSSKQPNGLMVSLMEQSCGIKPEQIRLSWLVPELNTSTSQYACQIQFALRVKDLESKHKLIWDSGKMRSDASIAVPFSGALALKTDQVYYWRVRVWTDEDTVSDWSTPHKTITAAQDSQWTAQPIWLPTVALSGEQNTPNNWLLARKPFVLNNAKLDSAWIRISAKSPEPARQYVFRLWLNGTLVGLGPVRAMANESRYHTFDVTAQLNQPDNTLAALCYSQTDQALLAELVLSYSDGQRQIIATDASWKTLSGNDWRPDCGSIANMYYQAPQEYIDARQEPVGWLNNDFDDRAWHNAQTVTAISDLEPAWVDPMQVTYQKPLNITPGKPGHWVLDFGKEVVGGIRLDTKGIAGQTVELRLGEELNADGSVRFKLRAFPVYQEVWTLRDGQQQLEHWGYRAFRWVEIITSPDMNLSHDITAAILKMPWDAHQASFESSDQSLNRVWELCRYSIEATRQDIYQDTPTRERGVYEGDAIINQLSEYSTQRSYALARYSRSFLVRRPTWPTEYRLQTALLAWQDYLHTGDDTNLAADYQLIVAHQLLNNLNAQGLLEKDPGQSSQPNGDLVDWPITNRDGFVFTPINCVINTWQYAALIALSNIAQVLGYEQDKRRFTQFAKTLKQAINQHMLSDNYRYRDGVETTHQSQHATAFALALGVTFEQDIAQVGDSLKQDLQKRGMQVSVYGAQFLLDALYAANQGETAHDLLVSRAQFSWLHMTDDLNATIVMEAWDPSIKSNTTFSHAWGSAPANVVQRHIAGVQITQPGAAHILIAPQPGRLQWFNAKVPTIRGGVNVNFNRASRTILSINLPPNVKADLMLDLRQMLDIDVINLAQIRVVNDMNETLQQQINGFALTVKDLQPGLTLVKI